MNLELEEMKLSLERVKLGRKEQEFTILQRRADIARLEKSIEVSKAKESELADKIAALESKGG